jgi:hypothetical protein
MRFVLALLALALLHASQGAVQADPNRIPFPETYRTEFVPYAVRNRLDLGQLRHLFANKIAADAMQQGVALPHGAVLVAEIFVADTLFEAGDMLFLAVMQSGPGWGEKHPQAIRNGDWNYAAFDPVTKRLDAERSERSCLECHKAAEKTEYVFSWDELVAHVRALPHGSDRDAALTSGEGCAWSQLRRSRNERLLPPS